MTHPTLDCITVLFHLGEDTLSVKGLAERITGDTTSEALNEVSVMLFDMVESGMVDTYEAGDVTWYQAVGGLSPRRTLVRDGGYASEDPGDGRPDRLYGN